MCSKWHVVYRLILYKPILFYFLFKKKKLNANKKRTRNILSFYLFEYSLLFFFLIGGLERKKEKKLNITKVKFSQIF